MKKDIHPDYKKTTIKCVCGNEIETGSVVDGLTVEICNHCHPFYTVTKKSLTQKVVLKDSKNVINKNKYCKMSLNGGIFEMPALLAGICV